MSEAALPSASTAATYTVSPARLPGGGNRVPRQGAGRVDEAAARIQVARGQERVDRHVGEVGVGEEAVAVVERELLGLDEKVHGVGAQVLHGAERERLHEREHLEDGEALGGRWRLVDGHAAVGAGERRPQRARWAAKSSSVKNPPCARANRAASRATSPA